MTTTVFSIGHSNHPIDRFIELLKTHKIETLADIRSRPASRFAPQFNRKALETSLCEAGISYVYFGDRLGGRARTDTSDSVSMDLPTRMKDPAFLSGLGEITDVAASARTAMMCAERDPVDCHRNFLVGRALVGTGVEVQHILPGGSLLEQERELL